MSRMISHRWFCILAQHWHIGLNWKIQSHYKVNGQGISVSLQLHDTLLNPHPIKSHLVKKRIRNILGDTVTWIYPLLTLRGGQLDTGGGGYGVFFLICSADSAKEKFFLTTHEKKIKSLANRWNVSCPRGKKFYPQGKTIYCLVSEMKKKLFAEKEKT